MSIQPPERVDFGLELIEHLDYDFSPPCEHSEHQYGTFGHSGPAWALVECLRRCGCRWPKTLYLCRGAWDSAAVTGLRCRDCGTEHSREQAWRFVALVS